METAIGWLPLAMRRFCVGGALRSESIPVGGPCHGGGWIKPGAIHKIAPTSPVFSCR